MKRITAAFLVLCMIFAMSACSLLESYDVRFVASQTSPDGQYTVTLYQVGNPKWSFGSVKAKLVLTDANGNQIAEENFSLNNDGTDVYAENMEEIHWQSNQVSIVVGESDTAKKYTYVFRYGES